MTTAAPASPEPHVIMIAPEGATGSLRVLIERLAGVGIPVTVVHDVARAADLVANDPANPPCILLDLRELTSADADEQQLATDAVKRALFVLPQCTPVVVTGEAQAGLLVACVRAGAVDLLDLGLEGTAAARQVVTRVWQRQRERLIDAAQAASLRAMVEDLLKDLIKTERRSIDLEDKIIAYRRQTREMQPLSETRLPAILLVEPDRELATELAQRLEALGVTTYAYGRGEDALANAESLAMGATMFDLALVTAQLPGIDGLETISRLRERHPGLPAFLVTSIHDGALAEQAADLGVVGFVAKPLVDLDEVVGRLAQLAKDALGRTREHSYLERIKTRHERVLARYRALPREA